MTDCLWMLNDNLMQCAKQKRISKQFAKYFYGSSKIFHCLNPLFSGIYKIFLQTIISRPFEICEPNQEQCMVWGVTAITAVQGEYYVMKGNHYGSKNLRTSLLSFSKFSN